MMLAMLELEAPSRSVSDDSDERRTTPRPRSCVLDFANAKNAQPVLTSCQ
jgi:hypothetical protein